jgi:ATP-dependent RNA helicase SUPV3L1/SUV3
MSDAHGITALLGPTNTGKTHRAIERMLDHDSGMIGLPLRLLAREVYDRITAKLGESRVALVTGEEQRVPPRPSYWIATVEAMPTQREVDFLAVDEVQLATHRERGHAFTSRILHARGRKETWLLGAGTMKSVLEDLVPTARTVAHPRLCRLAFAGSVSLSRLPPRSAVVAFSMAHVYELAERLHSKRGGAAVVLGALSPRTRNAQVAMFQAGEVDYLVATDAIGMGLNLDVAHVAFASVRKFDGAQPRDLEDDELAQIAGRAGRWIQDGTFGTLEPVELGLGTARAIEQSRFAAVRRVRWRNDDLDFSSPRALRESLALPPHRAALQAAPDAEDARALRLLLQREEVLRAAHGEERVRLLWNVCTVPDFRKLLAEVHAELLAGIYLELVKRDRLDDDFLHEQLRDLDDTSGDVDALVARIARVRTWAYCANRDGWLASPQKWQEVTRALEDRLSDALHVQLVSRFVGERRSRPLPRPRPRAPRPRQAIEDASSAPLPLDPGHPFASLAGLRARLTPPVKPVASSGEDWVADVVEARHEAFRLEPNGQVFYLGGPAGAGRILLGDVRTGASIALPDVRLSSHHDLGAGARSRLHRRVLAFARDTVGALTANLAQLAGARAAATPPLRALIHRLEQGLGTARTRDVADLVEALTSAERAELEGRGVRLGLTVVFVPDGVRGDAIGMRAALAAAFYAAPALAKVARRGGVSFAALRGIDPAAYTALGYPLFGGRAVRADIAEALRTRLQTSGEPEDARSNPERVASWLGCRVREVAGIVEDLSS